MTLPPEETFDAACRGLRRVFQPQNAANLDVVIQFTLAGEGGVEFFAVIRDQAITFESGCPPQAKVKMRMSAAEFLAMLEGTLSTSDAFASGKLKVGGNLMYAMKLASVFHFGKGG